MYQRRHKHDALFCDKCRERLLPETTRMGYAAFYCVSCDTLTVIYPRRVQHVGPMVAVQPGVTVRDLCVICGKPIATVIRRGAGERVIMCDSHDNEERLRWHQRRRGQCIVADCEARATSRGRCGRHYSRWWREQAKAGLEALDRIGDEV